MDIYLKILDFLNWQIADYVVLGLLMAAFLYQLYFYVRYMCAPLRFARRCKKGKVSRSEARPGVTVVVCARDEAHNLIDFLPHLLEQDYPEFEVIVVNDASEDDTDCLLGRFQRMYPNLRVTFVPIGTRVGSSKKLALTLAAKAAKYDYLLLTDADCRPCSRQWIAQMMQGFTEGTEIVLGYGAYLEEPTALSRLISYDTLFNGMHYLGAAINHRPYMGVGRNMAYRKATFFEHKGFAGMLGVKAGDDDLFVNKVANRHNTAVVLTKQSVTWSVPKHTVRGWQLQNERHLSVAPYYSVGSKLRLVTEPLTRALFYGSVIAACCMNNIALMLFALLLLLIRWLWQMIVLNRAASLVGQRHVGLQLPLYDIILPLNNLWIHFLLALFPKRKQRW